MAGHVSFSDTQQLFDPYPVFPPIRDLEDQTLQIIWNERLKHLFPGTRLSSIQEIRHWFSYPVSRSDRSFTSHLDLSRLNLMMIPLLREFHSLETLDLSHNLIRSIPEFLLYSNLKTLILSHNEILDLRAFSFASTAQREHEILPRLEVLDLSHNGIEQLPPPFLTWMSSRPSLRVVNLSSNPIDDYGTGVELLQFGRSLHSLRLEGTRIDLRAIEAQLLNPVVPLSVLDSRPPLVMDLNDPRAYVAQPSMSFLLEAEGLITGPQPTVIFRDFGQSVQSANQARHAAAVRDNQDGRPYLKTVILEHLESLSLEDKKEFKEKMASFDEAIFTLIPLITLKRLAMSWRELTKENTPHFLHKYLKSLCLIQRHWQKSGSQTDDQTLQRALGSITTALCRDPACIASIQMALSSL